MLHYEPVNQEINQLYLAFSKLTKTIKFAKNSEQLGANNNALMRYHEIADIFRELGSVERLSSCLNNLGCIYLRQEDFENSKIFL